MKTKSGIIRVENAKALEMYIKQGNVAYWTGLYDKESGRIIYFMILENGKTKTN